MVYRNQSDETLVMLTLAGEQRAYEVLVVRYEKAVIDAACSITHSRYMAEDAAQDAFVTAWIKLDMLREPEKYGGWVCRIAKNCAKNMVARFRGFLSLDAPEFSVLESDRDEQPEYWYASSEDRKLLHESIGKLPERVKQVIHLHYFEGLSIAEIAGRMRISEGTVKWQLHDGRKRIRKELCAMNENYNDTLVQRVMKKVEELKLWQVKNSKNGFETVYRDVLREVEELPECADKYHALADVLMRGWWWIAGEKNDALFTRIREAAEKGKNDEVMEFIVGREDEKLSGRHRIEFIRDKQIPRLEEAGFVKALGYEWFWLGDAYFDNKENDKGFEAYEKVISILKPSDLYYAKALSAIEMQKKRLADYAGKKTETYRLCSGSEEYRMLYGGLCRWKETWCSRGNLASTDIEGDPIFRNASCCDGKFTVDGLSVGETHVGSDGASLTFEAENVAVQTPAGRFDGCQLWVTRCATWREHTVYRTYYCDGVGIVKQERVHDGFVETRVLGAYRIVGGGGLVPCAAGNTWEYTADYDPSVLRQSSRFVMEYADDTTVVLRYNWEHERLRYDDNSWLDMILQIRNDYCQLDEKGRSHICDVSYPMERARALAVTPMEKAHTEAACSVARRILDTEPEFDPQYTATGHWNFFQRAVVRADRGKLVHSGNYRWSFEWKRTVDAAGAPILYNDVYGILQDAVQCIWSDEWRDGATDLVEYMRWGDRPVRTDISCEAIGSVTTAAGTFEDCLKVSLVIGGMDGGWHYRGGKKEYIFAPGVGIVRTVNYYCQNARRAVYELTAYEGTGEGYMPMADGMMRRYEALDLTDGYEASAEYTYAAADDGYMVIFEDRCGIRRKPDKITQYEAILGEQIEDELWEQGKREESRLLHDVNNFKILLHFLGRVNRNWAAPKKAAAWGKYRMSVIEFLAEGGDIPRAWRGHYANACFKAACAMFGYGNKEEGYEYLDRALELYPSWTEIPDGELLEVGNEQIYGGVKVVKGEGLIELPDGTREPIDYDNLFGCESGDMYYGMTAPRGWEWFNSVRNEDRFKAAVERAKQLMEISQG